jgi:hypothetical protein
MSRSYKNVRHERFEKVSKHERRTNTRQIRRQAHVQLARGEEGGIVENILTYQTQYVGVSAPRATGSSRSRVTIAASNSAYSRRGSATGTTGVTRT